MGIMHRNREMAAIIIIPIVLFLVSFSLEGTKFDFRGGITGFAIYEEQENYTHNVIDGTQFKITYQGTTSFYIFNEKKGWYESADRINWQKRPDLTLDMWKGLTYMYVNGATIYYNDQEIKDLAEFARNFR